MATKQPIKPKRPLGRPKGTGMPDAFRRNHFFRLRVNRNDFDRLTRLARLRGVSVSAYLRKKLGAV